MIKYVSFIVMFSLLQISLMLLEFTHFIFITIDIHVSQKTHNLLHNIHIL